MNGLPPRYYQKPNSLPRFILSLVTIFIMLLAIPVGVYLVGQRTHFLPQAKIENPPEDLGQTSFSLRQLPTQSTDSAQLIIDVVAHSDIKEANLFATRVNFPAEKLEVLSIATSAARLVSDESERADLKGEKLVADKWIEASFNNQKGEVNLIAGVPSPGIKTEASNQYLLSRIIFKIKIGGSTTFHLDPDSAILTNLDNKFLEVRKNDLTVDLASQPLVCQPRPACLDLRIACKLPEPAEGWCPKPTPTPRARFVQFRPPPVSLKLISPQGGETLAYNFATQIKWSAPGLDLLSVYLLVNGEKLGRIASASAKLNQISWKPADTLLPTQLNSSNTFQIELEGQTSQGQIFKDQSKGPFAIVNKELFLEASQAANLAQRGGDANHDGQITLTDLSILLSSFGKQNNLDLGVDLNGDGVVNEVDLWLFKGVLLK